MPDSTATYLREQAIAAFREATKQIALKDRLTASIQFGIFHALSDAYAVHTGQPSERVLDLLEAEALGEKEV